MRELSMVILVKGQAHGSLPPGKDPHLGPASVLGLACQFSRTTAEKRRLDLLLTYLFVALYYREDKAESTLTLGLDRVWAWVMAGQGNRERQSSHLSGQMLC